MGGKLRDAVRARLRWDVLSYAIFSALLYAFWLVFVGKASLPVLFAGVPVVLIPTLLFRSTYRAVAQSMVLVRAYRLLGFVLLAATEMARASIRVALWSVTPRLRLRSWILAYQTSMEDRLGLLLLSVVVTLTPGTLTMDLDRVEGVMHVHALAPADTDPALVPQAIRRLERPLERAVRS